MSQAVMQEIVRKAISDKNFAAQLRQNPTETLAVYESLLSAEEMQALTTMRPELLTSVGALVNGAPSRPAQRLMPRSFKEVGATVLSAVMIALVFYAAIKTYAELRVPPIVYAVGDNFQTVDTYDRARDLLNVFFPLVSAVVTFWLGVAIESRRADQSEAAAETAIELKEQAVADAQSTKQTSQATLDKVRQQVKALTAFGDDDGNESFNPNVTPASILAAQESKVDDILDTIDTARLEIGK